MARRSKRWWDASYAQQSLAGTRKDSSGEFKVYGKPRALKCSQSYTKAFGEAVNHVHRSTMHKLAAAVSSPLPDRL